MREMKHSKKLAFAVLVAIAAVGATVAPVNAESGVYGDNNTVDGYNAIAVGTEYNWLPFTASVEVAEISPAATFLS